MYCELDIFLGGGGGGGGGGLVFLQSCLLQIQNLT